MIRGYNDERKSWWVLCFEEIKFPKFPGLTRYERMWIFLIVILCLMLRFLYFFLEREVLDIYHGPYTTYTPVDLQLKRQRQYLDKFPLYRLWGKESMIVKAKVIENPDLGYEEVWKEAFKDNVRKKGMALFSVNTFFWLRLAKGKFPCDTVEWKLEADKLRLIVVGYKKAERPYYLLRLLTHKGGHFPVNQEEFSRAVYILNEKELSGSTHVTPEVYLLEKCVDTFPQILWESKSNMVKELIAYKPEGSEDCPEGANYPIGAISDREYDDLLDDGIRDSLIIRDVMVNIPHDPIVMIQEAWEGQKKKGRIDEVCKCLKDAGLIVLNKKEENEIKKIKYLQRMYRYYISLGILRKKEGRYYIHNPQYGEILDVLPKKVGKDSLHFYKVEYGNLGDHYYRFVPAGGSRVQLEKGWIISDTAKLESKLGYRVYIGEGSTPVDTLILDRDSCLYNY